jgi:hypothetical protein
MRTVKKPNVLKLFSITAVFEFNIILLQDHQIYYTYKSKFVATCITLHTKLYALTSDTETRRQQCYQQPAAEFWEDDGRSGGEDIPKSSLSRPQEKVTKSHPFNQVSALLHFVKYHNHRRSSHTSSQLQVPQLTQCMHLSPFTIHTSHAVHLTTVFD